MRPSWVDPKVADKPEDPDEPPEKKSRGKFKNNILQYSRDCNPNLKSESNHILDPERICNLNYGFGLLIFTT